MSLLASSLAITEGTTPLGPLCRQVTLWEKPHRKWMEDGEVWVGAILAAGVVVWTVLVLSPLTMDQLDNVGAYSSSKTLDFATFRRIVCSLRVLVYVCPLHCMFRWS